MTLDILAETKQWIAVNKPAGINVEQLWDYSSIEQQVADYLSVAGRKSPYVGVVHRLDRPVSGVLLLAKKKSTLKALNEQFAQRTVSKVYWAIVAGRPAFPAADLHHHLLKDQKNKRAIAYKQARKGSFPAHLAYQSVEQVASTKNEIPDRTCLIIRPFNGKFHQIRVQLSAIGCPIWGDVKYGGPAIVAASTITLHARKLTFFDPASQSKQTIEASIPTTENWEYWPIATKHE